MARPQQEILLTQDNTDVIQSNGLWAVLYRNKPINIRRQVWHMYGPTYKYIKVVFPNPAHAYRLRDRLNKDFFCDDFTVKQIL